MDIKKVKQAWARSVNNKAYRPYKDKIYGNKYHGTLYNVHYYVYNLLRGLNGFYGMENISSEKSREMADRIAFLTRKSMFTKEYDRLDELLLPFEDSITKEEILELLK